MAKNPHGATHRPNLERGRKARKEEDRIRGLNNQARHDAIADQANDELIRIAGDPWD